MKREGILRDENTNDAKYGIRNMSIIFAQRSGLKSES